jgi:SNF2 family DNA or RNA helicase
VIDTSLSSLILPTFSPREYQSEAGLFLVEHPRAMLVADPGLGKTGTSLLALDMLKLIGSSFFPALVLAPKRVADVVWSGEKDKWSSFQHLNVVQITGTEAERREILRRPVADLYICNYELVPWLISMWPQERWPFKIVIADECSRLKGFRLNKGTVRSTALADIAQYVGRWWNLTGTPAPNGLQDLWGQMYFVDFGQRLKRSYTAFSEAYLMEDRYTRKIKLQSGAAEAIQEAVKDVLVAYRAEDWLDITKPQEIPVEFELPPAARAQYKRMEKEFFLEVDDAQIEAGTAAIKSSKLLQICSGSIIDTDTELAHAVHEGRLEALDDVLDQIEPEQLLVSYWWTFDPPRILAHLKKRGIPARLYRGKQDEIDWNARKFRVTLLQEQSAFGLNLHEPCRDIFHYSYIWNAELWTQMIERVGAARQVQAGKKCVVRVWYAIAKGTVDHDVIDSNFGKITVEQAFKRARRRSRNGD